MVMFQLAFCMFTRGYGYLPLVDLSLQFPLFSHQRPMIVAEYLHGVVSYFRWSLVVSALFVGYIQICCGSIPIKKGQFMSIPQVFFD